ncbi:uncharacterized protein LOC123708027 isoform X2 [Pieris brassicae]|uniref:uncharacterized protein LOC123708027 isoform X2 n=1 Tax=Pieris brassicae TaxID=7116 RepID=UPI001E6615BD|nr:uncharacterized protein LOC123708027 isoform X2 [Pieris brassicae]
MPPLMMFLWSVEGKTRKVVTSVNPVSLSTNVIQRQFEPIDEAFVQHKDVLLEMLETKLKELREKKKKKHDSESPSRCNVGGAELRLNARGLSVVGEADAAIRLTSGFSRYCGSYGPLHTVEARFGSVTNCIFEARRTCCGHNVANKPAADNTSLALEASGVAAVGHARVTLNGPNVPHISGLGQLFAGNPIGDCTQSKTTNNTGDKTIDDESEPRIQSNVTESQHPRSTTRKLTQKFTHFSVTTPLEMAPEYPE